MILFYLALATFASTLLGGLIALRFKRHLHRLLGFTAGVLLGVVAFELLPEIMELAQQTRLDIIWPMLALTAGFITLHIIEKVILIHATRESDYQLHHHPHVGMVSAWALIGHSVLDGVAIGLGFQVNATVGFAVAIAVLAHDFTDGINTVNLMLVNKNSTAKAKMMLALDALAPIIGVALTLFFTLPDAALLLYLGAFAGFLLYIGASQILPEAHSKHSSYGTIGLTILGVGLMFFVSLVA